MAKEKVELEGAAKFNRVSKGTNVWFSLLFAVIAVCAVIPLVLVIIISFTDKTSIVRNGFSFFPDKLSLEAYRTLWGMKERIATSFGISLFVTIAGTAIGLFLNATMGYILSRKSFKFRKLYTYIVFIPMVFYGGIVANYLVVTKFLYINDTLLALMLPMAVTSFYVIILRTFFTTTVPDSLIESGKIDGASQLRIFFQIVLPISLPALATIGLFLSFAYWNDWWHAMMYLDNTKLYPLQFILMKIEQNVTFMAQMGSMGNTSMAEILAKMPTDGVRMALVVIAVVPIACSYPFFQRYFVSGLTIGAVKG